jgi:hypothetical protein
LFRPLTATFVVTIPTMNFRQLYEKSTDSSSHKILKGPNGRCSLTLSFTALGQLAQHFFDGGYLTKSFQVGNLKNSFLWKVISEKSF